jgi:two-component system OmpR family sensor kinase
MTLRLRLLLLLVVIVAAGLLISDVITYTSLRAFLTQQIDKQLLGSTFPVERALVSSTGAAGGAPAGVPGRQLPTGRPGGGATVPGSVGAPAVKGRAPGREVLIPPGTFGELRDPHGTVIAHVFFDYGGAAPLEPRIPAVLPGLRAGGSSVAYFTTGVSGGGGPSYRVVARSLPFGGGTVVVAQPLTDLQGTLRRLFLIEVVASAFLLAALGAVSWVLVRRDLRPLEEMAVTAGAIAGGDLSLRVTSVTPGTEVGELGLAFNTMIGEIEDAFAARAAGEERLRRFVADASHELRTPLTSILGFTELFDLGVRDRPADLAASMHVIRDEAARMSTLVDDLLLLAQAGRERPPVTEEVDLSEVVREAVASLAVTVPDRRVALDLGEAVLVAGDRSRLRQVVDNLVGNAVTHTPPGTAITVSTRKEGDRGILTVRDRGPGIGEADATRIFEPFYRSDPSRTRATGGAGLGLAIVAAIVASHGGTVTLSIGDGATFVVELPRSAADGGPPPAPLTGVGSFEHDRPNAAPDH